MNQWKPSDDSHTRVLLHDKRKSVPTMTRFDPIFSMTLRHVRCASACEFCSSETRQHADPGDVQLVMVGESWHSGDVGLASMKREVVHDQFRLRRLRPVFDVGRALGLHEQACREVELRAFPEFANKIHGV